MIKFGFLLKLTDQPLGHTVKVSEVKETPIYTQNGDNVTQFPLDFFRN